MPENHQGALLVTGASGHLGRRVLELLTEAGAGTIIAATRTPEKLADFSPRGVIVRQGDFDHPTSLVEAFAGVDRLLLISTDAIMEPGKRLKQHIAAVKAAQDAGVSHVVYASLVASDSDSPILLTRDHYGTETALAASTMGWTVLRNNFYAESIIGSLTEALKTGKLSNAAGNGKAAYITREDCARAAAAALASAFTGRRTLDVTGPEALTQADLAAITTRITGKQVIFIPLELNVVIQSMLDDGLPPHLAEIFGSVFTGVAQGALSKVTSVFEDLTGRKPTSVAEFLADNRDTLMQAAAQ